MSANMEQPMQTPRRNKHKTPRKENQQAAQYEQGHTNSTPIAIKNNRGHKNNLREFVNTTSVSSLSGYQNSSTEAFDAGEASHSQSQKKRRNKKRTGEHSQPEQVNIKLPLSPPPATQQAMYGTPVKAMQMYAGPTFHTSPAPSSLPLPKFFAQNMALGKASQGSTEVLGTPPDDSLHESSSQSSEDSPTLRNALPSVAVGPAREASPLDIFFKADREEKARKTNLPDLMHERAKSASPAHDNSASSVHTPFFAEAPSNFAAPATPTSPESQNYAKTLALKQLLLFPHAQRTPKSADSAQSSPFLDIPYRPSVGRSSSETNTPTTSTLNLHDMSPGRDFYDPPSLSRPLGSRHVGQDRRPLPHHLRQEFLKSLSLDQSPDVSSKNAKFAPMSQA